MSYYLFPQLRGLPISHWPQKGDGGVPLVQMWKVALMRTVRQPSSKERERGYMKTAIEPLPETSSSSSRILHGRVWKEAIWLAPTFVLGPTCSAEGPHSGGELPGLFSL